MNTENEECGIDARHVDELRGEPQLQLEKGQDIYSPSDDESTRKCSLVQLEGKERYRLLRRVDEAHVTVEAFVQCSEGE